MVLNRKVLENSIFGVKYNTKDLTPSGFVCSVVEMTICNEWLCVGSDPVRDKNFWFIFLSPDFKLKLTQNNTIYWEE